MAGCWKQNCRYAVLICREQGFVQLRMPVAWEPGNAQRLGDWESPLAAKRVVIKYSSGCAKNRWAYYVDIISLTYSLLTLCNGGAMNWHGVCFADRRNEYANWETYNQRDMEFRIFRQCWALAWGKLKRTALPTCNVWVLLQELKPWKCLKSLTSYNVMGSHKPWAWYAGKPEKMRQDDAMLQYKPMFYRC